MFGINLTINGISIRDSDVDITHLLLDKHSNILVRYVKTSDDNTEQTITKKIDLSELALIEDWRQTGSTGFDGTYNVGIHPQYLPEPLVGLVIVGEGFRRFHSSDWSEELFIIDLESIEQGSPAVGIHISDDYPLYLVWPENDAQVPFTTFDEVGYVDYDGIVEHTKTEVRQNYLKTYGQHIERRLQRIKEFADDANEEAATQLYFDYLHNRIFHMLNPANLNDDDIWTAFKEEVDSEHVDRFFKEFDMSTARSRLSALKLKLQSHARLYAYENRDFVIHRSLAAVENPDPIPDNTPALGRPADLIKTREILELHPLQEHGVSHLTSLAFSNPSTGAVYTLSPTFAQDTLSYTMADVDLDNVTVGHSKGFALQTFAIADEMDGTDRVYTITVTSLNGESTTVYTVRATPATQ